MRKVFDELDQPAVFLMVSIGIPLKYAFDVDACLAECALNKFVLMPALCNTILTHFARVCFDKLLNGSRVDMNKFCASLRFIYLFDKTLQAMPK